MELEERAKSESGVIDMSGLVARNSAGQSGLAAPKVDFQRFATSGTHNAGWVKPGDVSIVWIECIGAGGGGGCDAASGDGGAASGGGGGGAFSWACFSAAALPATLDVIVGAGGSGANSNGDPGGDTEVHISSGLEGSDAANKVLLKAFGGGGGAQDNDAGSGGAGGGGGGTGSAGPTASGSTAGNGGAPYGGGNAGQSLGGRGAQGGTGGSNSTFTDGKSAE